MGIVRYAERVTNSVYANEDCDIQRRPVRRSTNNCNADKVP